MAATAELAAGSGHILHLPDKSPGVWLNPGATTAEKPPVRFVARFVMIRAGRISLYLPNSA